MKYTPPAPALPSAPRHAPSSDAYVPKVDLGRRHPGLRGYRILDLADRLVSRFAKQGDRVMSTALRRMRNEASEQLFNQRSDWSEGLETKVMDVFRQRPPPSSVIRPSRMP